MSIAIRKFNIVHLLLSKSIFNTDITFKILTFYWNILDNKNNILLKWINITLL